LSIPVHRKRQSMAKVSQRTPSHNSPWPYALQLIAYDAPTVEPEHSDHAFV